MAKKILGGRGGLVGIGGGSKKKTAPAETPAPAKAGPIIKSLGMMEETGDRRNRTRGRLRDTIETILSDKLGA